MLVILTLLPSKIWMLIDSQFQRARQPNGLAILLH